jgi:glycosyltransferase involved in cell wall biosynthesis
LKIDCILLLVGNGPLRQEILRNGRRFGIEDRIKIIDHVPSLEVQNYLNCFDCLVLPSLTRPNWKEQFGRVLPEAMACEVPVIGSDSGEIPSVIGDAGLVFHEGDTADLAKKLEVVLADQN